MDVFCSATFGPSGQKVSERSIDRRILLHDRRCAETAAAFELRMRESPRQFLVPLQVIGGTAGCIEVAWSAPLATAAVAQIAHEEGLLALVSLFSGIDASEDALAAAACTRMVEDYARQSGLEPQVKMPDEGSRPLLAVFLYGEYPPEIETSRGIVALSLAEAFWRTLKL